MEPASLPAFLDRWDEIRLWLPAPASLTSLKDKVVVRAGQQLVGVAQLLPGAVAIGDDPEWVVVAGSLQAALGGREWDPAGDTTRMTRLRAGVYELTVRLPAGRYAYKITRGGSWAKNWGARFAPDGPNIPLVVSSPQLVRFIVDFGHEQILDSINQPVTVPPPTMLPPPPQPTPPHDVLYQSVVVRLAQKRTPAQLAEPLTVQVGEGTVRTVYARGVLDDPTVTYTGSALGARWTPQQTTFTLWSPVAAQATLLLYDSATAPTPRRVPLRRGAQGTWTVTVGGNLAGRYYQYELISYGQRWVAADLYGVAASADSSRSVVVDLSQTNPPGWPAPRCFKSKRPTDAVLYEAHLRDLTHHPSSGVRPAWRGKYLGLTEPHLLDYLQQLGITHLHLLPFQDFNPGHSQHYNWGYETTLFNVPEEQYATRTEDPTARIREVKQMVQALQRRGIGVVMDVVYNHSVPSEGPHSAFWAMVPYYYFRTNDRGDVLNESGVGNALHDERPMVRTFIADSLAYWAREYRMDGFRFDLLGMFTRETVAALVHAVRRENPDAILYGEPWTGGGPTRFGKGAQKNTGMAVFNDHTRNVLRGELDGTAPGFAMGGPLDRTALENTISGALHDFAARPTESVNYVSAHDNRTFWDRVERSLPDTPLATRVAAVQLAHATILLSQGIPFIEGGIELGRTKRQNPNSYDAGDPINQYDWARGREFVAVRRYLTGLIALRRAHPAFRMALREQVERHLHFLPASALPAQTVAYRLDGRAVGDSWPEVLVVLYGGRTAATLTLPTGDWLLVVDGQRSGTQPLARVTGTLPLTPLSAFVLYRR